MITNQIKYVAYYRASTEKQRDGLGLEAQQTAINNFINTYGGEIVGSFSEIVSGGSLDRKIFNAAVNEADSRGATLLVHKIDRLSRSGYATMALLEDRGVPFIEATAPNDSDFSRSIKFLVAKEERDRIKGRVIDSLAEIKKNIRENGSHVSKAGNVITSLGRPENLTEESRKRSIEVRMKKARDNDNNLKAYAVVKLMKDKSLRYIANYLNNNDFKTSRGKSFHASQVKNLIEMYEKVNP